MEGDRMDVKGERVRFNYRTNETKYYLLTEGSGYPLADFHFPNLAVQRGTGLVVPENRPKTANITPGSDATQLT
ncbi:MAG: hypothetical protein K6T29_00035 [Peptococcaceae bacterium]|nr:hypothetical protein [Peptococcaceae bacterium]